MLVAVLHPLDRPVELERGPAHRDGLAVEMGLQAEPAADVGADHPDVVELEPEEGGDAALHRVGKLVRHPDHQLVQPAVVMGQRAAAFHRKRRLAGHLVTPRDGMDRGGLGGLEIAILEGGLAHDVVRPAVMHQRASGLAAAVDVEDHGQFLAFDLDRIGDVLGLGPGRRHRDGDLLADIADLVFRQDREVGPLEARERSGRADRLDVGHVGRSEHLALEPLGRAHREQPAVGNLAAPEGGMPHAGDLHVGHELPRTHEIAVILLAGDARTDSAIAHLRLPVQERPFGLLEGC